MASDPVELSACRQDGMPYGMRPPAPGRAPNGDRPPTPAGLLATVHDGSVLPVQLARAASLRGEERLLFAMLADAVTCFQNYAFARDPRLYRLYAEAREWIYAEADAWPFSFRNVCDTLGIAPAYVREGLDRWLAAAARGAAMRRGRRVEPDPASPRLPYAASARGAARG